MQSRVALQTSKAPKGLSEMQVSVLEYRTEAEVMPMIGDITRGKYIGFLTSPARKSQKYIWLACEWCGKERWVPIRKDKTEYTLCAHCVKVKIGIERKMTRDYQYEKRDGYIEISLKPDHPFYQMVDCRGVVLAHRLVMAEYLGRILLSKEVVHHKGINFPMGSKENKHDNCIENLQLFPSSAEHRRYHRQFDKYKK